MRETKRKLSVLSFLLLCAGCADDSFVVVSVTTHSGSLDNVDQLRVYVKSGTSEDVLLYPKKAARPMHLDTLPAVTFSIDFGSSTGAASVEVEPLASDGAVLAYGRASASIVRRGVVSLPVEVFLGAVRPAHPPGGEDSMLCAPSAPADACGANRTCGVLCSPQTPAASLCYGAGTRDPGESCTSTNDCSPGAQCFTFSAAGCNVTTCLKFCDDDSSCGGNANCNVPVACGTSAPFKTCSRPCDPTLASSTGCAPGLACSVYAGNRTDCACPGLGSVGASCTRNSGCSGEPGCAGCSAGLSCVIATGAVPGSGTGVCRPVCRLADRTCPAGTTCHAFDNASQPLYGFCQ
jgi:hypothetical protein